MLDQREACAKDFVELRNKYEVGTISEDESKKMYELSSAMGLMENILRTDVDRKFRFEYKVLGIARGIF